jgi:hypothetical protein
MIDARVLAKRIGLDAGKGNFSRSDRGEPLPLGGGYEKPAATRRSAPPQPDWLKKQPPSRAPRRPLAGARSAPTLSRRVC